MYYKRNEPFRYTFKKRTPAEILLIRDNQRFDIRIINISQNGLRLESSHQLTKHDKIIVSFTIIDQRICAIGEIVWVKIRGRKCECGVTLDTDNVYRTELITLLKQLAKTTS
ncbi:PilZ domain-containing protein [Aquibacillus salsiterrae]|uniref:PilZ domain-containing protein n=1 Tax=Aquibacillus salsiterrae TaxID=2950439 RepID=A0A9X3WD76_9BACI|nr:PilZ domain-containing protein [Aquibacillus salsiterrae]MDC3416553.1 PilZ domain-containing protein [Aquibacillus salsiterrae]